VLVTLTACLVVVLDASLSSARARTWVPAVAVAGLLLALPAGPLPLQIAWPFPDRPQGEFATGGFASFVRIDEFTQFFRATFIVLAIFAILVAPSYLGRKRVPAGEYYATLLFSTVGAMTIALSTDLITLFVGLELMTIPVYVLAGIQRRDRFSNEAALKYFLLGAFSSALLVYGFAWLFGVTGTTRFDEIAAVLRTSGVANGPTIIALSLIPSASLQGGGRHSISGRPTPMRCAHAATARRWVEGGGLRRCARARERTPTASTGRRSCRARRGHDDRRRVVAPVQPNVKLLAY
jgi:NADH-quinone oxidoreductase subunit N